MTDAPISIPIYCQQCGRANGAAAKRCIWCGIPIVEGTAPGSFEETRIEIDYLDGLDRLEEPAPVKLVIGPLGIEVSEVMPGSRTVKIDADSIIEARVVDASTTAEGKRVRSPWSYLLGPLALVVRGKQLPETKKHDYILMIRYRDGEEIRNAVFHREDRVGLSVVNGLAKIVSLLVRMRGQNPGGEGG